LIIGANEAERGMVGVKDLRSGEQIEVRRDEVAAWLQTRKEALPS
jgi:histidyl-tRNA synthetase